MTDFYTGDINKIPDKDIIIASHVMEHIVNDKELVIDLLDKCKELYVFVPYIVSFSTNCTTNWSIMFQHPDQ